MNWLKDRMGEPSTYAGLAAILAGVGQLADINEAPAIADAITNAAPLALSGNWVGAVGALLMGSLAVFMRDRK